MLRNGALIDERTQSRLGEEALDELLFTLWEGDCQSCGEYLGTDPPAVRIDDLGALTKASLHHPACQVPTWNDSLLITASTTATLSWRSVAMLIPLKTGTQEGSVTGLLVNPSLEEVWLRRKSGTWHCSVSQAFAASGLTSPADGIPFGAPASGVAGHPTADSLSVTIHGISEIYEAPVQPVIRANLLQQGGFLLIITHAANPQVMNPAALDRALSSTATAVGWVRLN